MKRSNEASRQTAGTQRAAMLAAITKSDLATLEAPQLRARVRELRAKGWAEGEIAVAMGWTVAMVREALEPARR